MNRSRKTKSLSVVPPTLEGPQFRRLIEDMREIVETREGNLGDPLKRFVTVGELADTGAFKASVGAGGVAVISQSALLRGGSNAGEGSFNEASPDLGFSEVAAPPASQSIKARGIGVGQVMITWGVPPYSNHYYAEIFFTAADDLAALTAGFNLTIPYGPNDNLNAYFVGRSFGNSFLHKLPPATTGGYYWVRFITTALVAGPFNTAGVYGQQTADPDEFMSSFQGVAPLEMDAAGNVGVRGDLVVTGLVTANDVDVRGLLTASEIWAKSIIGLEANFDLTFARRLIIGPKYVTDIAGDRQIDTLDNPYSGTGQWRLALNSPSTPYNKGQSDGVSRLIHYYRPTFSGGSELNTVNAADEAFYLDQLGNVFIGGNLTIRTQGSPIAANRGSMLLIGANGSGPNSAPYYEDDANALVHMPAYNRFSLWMGKKRDYINDGAREANGIIWAREGLDETGTPVFGLNANILLGGLPFGMPVLVGTNKNEGSEYISTKNSARARTLVQSVISNDRFYARTYLDKNGVVQYPPLVVLLNFMLVSFDAGETDNGDSKKFKVTAEIVQDLNTSTVVALIQEVICDDFYMEAMPMNLMGAVQLPAGYYRIRIKIERMQDRYMSIIAGWKAIVLNTLANGEFNLIERGLLDPTAMPTPKPLNEQGYIADNGNVVIGPPSPPAGQYPENP